MTVEPATSPPTGPRGVPLVVAGVVVLVVLLGVAALLWLTADRRYDDNVAGFARAPSGCDTTLDFERTGTFTLYVETTGILGALQGDCDTVVAYDRDPADSPTVQLELRSVDGETLEVVDTDGPSYDTGTYVGVGAGVVEVSEPGDYVITVDGDGGPAFAVAVGGDPDDGVTLLRWGAASAAIVGLVAAGALFVVASRRPDPVPEHVVSPEPTWPTGPPGFPAPPPTTGATMPALPTPIPGQPPLAGTSTAPPLPAPAPAAPPAHPPAPEPVDGTDVDTPSPWAPPSA